MLGRKSTKNELALLRVELEQSKLDKVSLLREVELLRERVKQVEAEKENLFLRLEKMSEALIAKESPTAYSVQQMNRPLTPEELEEERKQKELRRIYQEFSEMYDKEPLFMSPDDMCEKLSSMGLPESAPLHENEES